MVHQARRRVQPRFEVRAEAVPLVFFRGGCFHAPWRRARPIQATQTEVSDPYSTFNRDEVTETDTNDMRTRLRADTLSLFALVYCVLFVPKSRRGSSCSARPFPQCCMHPKVSSGPVDDQRCGQGDRSGKTAPTLVTFTHAANHWTLASPPSGSHVLRSKFFGAVVVIRMGFRSGVLCQYVCRRFM